MNGRVKILLRLPYLRQLACFVKRTKRQERQDSAASRGVSFPIKRLAVNVFRPDTLSERHAARQTQLDFAATVVCMLQVNVIASSRQAIDIAAKGTVMVLN